MKQIIKSTLQTIRKDTLRTEIQKLIKENERLKTTVKTKEKSIDNLIDYSTDLRGKCDSLLLKNKEVNKKNHKLSEGLSEIINLLSNEDKRVIVR